MATVGQPLRMSNVFAVFGATRFSQLTRGNKVPNYPANGAVADNTAGLRFSQLGGATTDAPAPTYNAQMNYLGTSDQRPRGGPYASGQLTMNSDGGAYEGTSSHAARRVFSWLLGGSAGEFDIQCVLDSGPAPAGSPLNTWLSLDTSRTWSLTNTNNLNQFQETYLTFNLRHRASGTQWRAQGAISLQNGDPT